MEIDQLKKLKTGLYKFTSAQLINGDTAQVVKLPPNTFHVFTANTTRIYSAAQFAELVETIELVYAF